MIRELLAPSRPSTRPQPQSTTGVTSLLATSLLFNALLATTQLGMLARTCRTFRKAALRALEEKAQELLVSRYFQESHLIKFIDAFACFGWAMSLTESLTPATVATWRAEELDASQKSQKILKIKSL